MFTKSFVSRQSSKETSHRFRAFLSLLQLLLILSHRQKALLGSVHRHASWIERHAGLRDSSAAPAAICPHPGSAGVK